MNTHYSMAALAGTLLLAACQPNADSPRGFRLPEGNAEAGKVAFVAKGCIQCHTVAGEEFAPPPGKRELELQIGGEVHRAKTYAELVTSIMNPSHVVAEKYRTEQGLSLMPDLTRSLTVREMIDLTQFLQAHYEVVPPDPPYANPYGYGYSGSSGQ